jgi:hypothetical protein
MYTGMRRVGAKVNGVVGCFERKVNGLKVEK